MRRIAAFLTVLLLFSLTFRVGAQDDGNYRGFQFGIFPPLSTNGSRAADCTNGASVNILIGMSANERGFALAGLSNIVYGNATGVQIAAFSNHIGNYGRGLALAGVANVAKGGYTGLMFSGLVNVAGNVTGMQFAGLVNVAKKVRGVQFATLVNVADECDWPIGLVNVIKKGDMGIALTYDALGTVLVSFRSGGRYSYGILGVGYNHKTGRGDKIVTEAGYGIHIPVCRWFGVNNEFKVATIGASSEVASLNAGYLLAPSFRIKEHYNIFAGVGVNYLNTESSEADRLVSGGVFWYKVSGNRTQLAYMGYQIGIQYIF